MPALTIFRTNLASPLALDPLFLTLLDLNIGDGNVRGSFLAMGFQSIKNAASLAPKPSSLRMDQAVMCFVLSTVVKDDYANAALLSVVLSDVLSNPVVIADTVHEVFAVDALEFLVVVLVVLVLLELEGGVVRLLALGAVRDLWNHLRVLNLVMVELFLLREERLLANTRLAEEHVVFAQLMPL